MAAELHLYHYWRSSCSWRVRWALELKGLPYRSTAINLLKEEQKSDEYLRLNPTGLVPTLKVDGRFLSDSFAIIEWLEETYPQKPLLPKDPWGRAEVRSMSMMVAAGIQPLGNLRVINHYSDIAEKKKEWIQHFMNVGLQPIERLLEKKAGTYCFGDTVTMADIFLVPQIYNALRFDVDLNPFPRSKRIYESCLKLESCDRAAPHNQEGAN